MTEDRTVQLVQNERAEEDDRHRVRRPDPADQRADEQELYDTVADQIEDAESADRGRPGELLGGSPNVDRDEIVRIFAQLVLGERPEDEADRRGRHDEEDEAADQLERTVDPFDRERESKRAVNDARTLLRHDACGYSRTT